MHAAQFCYLIGSDQGLLGSLGLVSGTQATCE